MFKANVYTAFECFHNIKKCHDVKLTALSTSALKCLLEPLTRAAAIAIRMQNSEETMKFATLAPLDLLALKE